MIDIKRNNVTILSVPVNDNAVWRKDLMTENVITLNFELADYVAIKKGDTITFETLVFTLHVDAFPKINPNTGGYQYELSFYGIEKSFEDYLLMYNSGLLEAEFTLTHSLDNHLAVVVASLTRAGLGTFTYPAYNSTVYKEITYSNLTIKEGLQLIADTYELDWWVDGTVIHVEECELGTEIELAYDQELDSIDYNEASEKMITRLYAFGSKKNLPINYRTESGVAENIAERRLRMNNGLADVDYVELSGMPIIEGVQIFEDVFPKQSNTITAVTLTEIPATEKTLKTYIYVFKDDAGLQLVQSDIMAGQPLKVVFTSGALNGREFELILKEQVAGKSFYEIKYVQEGNIVIPNDVLKPIVGDTYMLFNFNPVGVLSSLVTTAEQELYTKALNYLNNIGHETVYTCKTRSIYCENNAIDLQIGQKVALTIQFDNVAKVIHSRILSFEKSLINKYEATYVIGDSKRYSRLNEITKKIEDKPTTREVLGLEGAITNALSDFKLNDAEKAAWGETLRSLQNEYNSYLTTVTQLKANILLTDETALNTDWVAYDSAINTLIGELNRVRSLQVITVTDRSSIEAKLSAYGTALSNLIAEIETSREAIKTNTIDNIQVGGRNLLSVNAPIILGNENCIGTKNAETGYKYTLSDYHECVNSFTRYNLLQNIKESGTYSISFWYKTMTDDACGNVLINGDLVCKNGVAAELRMNKSVWEYFSGTVNVVSNIGTHGFLQFQSVDPINYSYSFYISDIMVVKGSIPMEYSPAPEDVHAQIEATQLFVQYSADGINWHNNYQTGDVYLRQKIGVNSSWGASIKFVGADGTSVTIKGHVANFAALPTSGMSVGDGYVTDDNGHLCVYMPDLTWSDVGSFRGTDGLPSYVHIAYASDANGTNFSTSDPTNRDWIGVCSDHVSTDPETYQSYTWKLVKGAKGEDGKAAYTVLLTNESHNFMGNKVGAFGTSIVVEVITLKGIAKIASNLPDTIIGATGISISEIVDGTTDANAHFKVTVTNALTTGGTIDIPIVVDSITFTKKFTYSVSLEGADGVGIDAKDVRLSTTSQILKKDVNGSYTPATAQITAVLQNVLQADLTWSYSENGGVYSTVLPNGVTVNGSVRVLTAANMTANTITFKASNGTLYDTITVAKVLDGEKGDNATVYELVSSSYISNKNITGAYNPATLVFSALKTVGNDTATAYSGRYKIYLNGSGTATYTSSADEASKSYTIPANTTSIKVELYLAGGTSTKIDETTIAITNDGTGGLTCSLSNEAHSVPCDAAESPISYTGSGTDIYVSENGNNLSYVTGTPAAGQFSVSASASGITCGAITAGTNPFRAMVGAHQGMTANPAQITYTITACNSKGVTTTLKKVQTLTKSITGASGNDAIVYELVSSSYVANKNAITGAYTPAVINLSGLKTIGNGTPAAFGGIYKIYRNGTLVYTSITSETLYNYTIPADTTSIKVELYLGAVKVDETTIAISNDGQIGQAGKNALNCFLSNSAHGIPCNKDGQPLSYTASGTEIYVQEGDNYLDFVASLTGNSQFTVTSSASGITRGSIIDSSTPNRATVTDHSAMTTNPASITYTIIANNSQGFQSTFKLVQTFTKTLVGATGDAGRGVSSVRPLYILSTSKTSAPTLPTSPSTLNGWTPTAPAWEVDKYLWRTEEITYTQSPLYVYTTATVDTSWEAVNEINIGGVNLMRNGNFLEGQNNWTLNYAYGETVPLFARELSGSNVPEGVIAIGKITTYAAGQGIWQQHREIDKLQLGKYYTVSCIAKSESGNTTLRFGIDGTTRQVTLTTSWVRYIFTFKAIAHQNFVFYLGGAGVFYISNIQLEEGNQATAFKSGYLESVIQGIVETNGGLLLGNLLGAKDSAGFVRSYMSGVSTNPTAFAAGVQNFGTGNETRNIDIRHNGTAKFGKLEVDELGTIFIVDENGKRRFELNTNALPQISTITSQSSINTDYTSNSVSVTTTTSGTCSATAPVTVAGSTLYVYIEANTFANIAAFGDSATAELKIYLRRNGSATGQVLLMSLRSDAFWTQTTFLPIPDEYMEPQDPITVERKNLTDSDTLFIDNMAFPNIELGTYSIYYEFTRTVSGTGTRTTQGNINDVNLRISYSADKTQLIIGKDGLLAYYGANKYVSINQTDANQPFVRMQGKISIPALVYATTSPPSSISVGGAFAGTGHSRNTSTIIIYHTIGDTNYTAIITPTTGGTHDFYVYTKAPTYIIISGTGTYDITLIRTI